MISAFGVEHGVSTTFVAKSWKKLAPKLARVSNVSKPGQSMQERMRVDYTQWREKSGYLHRELNPKKWDKSDNDWFAHSGKRPDPSVLAIRAKGEARTREKATNNKKASKAIVSGISANNRRNRKPLP
jgi:hypothetical protein